MPHLKIGFKSLGLAFFFTLSLVWSGLAQTPVGNAFNYTVQPGDTLLLVALRYDLTPNQIILTNQLPSAHLLFPGQILQLSGGAIPKPFLTELPPLRAEPHQVQAGESLFSIATQYGVSMGSIILVNNLPNPDLLQIGQTLLIPEGAPIPEPLSAPFDQITLSEPVIIQGRTLVVKVRLSEAATVTGTFEGRPLFFENDGSGQVWAIVAIHALTEPNIYPITLTAALTDGSQVTAFSNVTIVEGPYSTEHIQLDATRGELLTDNFIELEREKLVGLWSQVSPRPRWTEPFRYPVVGEAQFTSFFGTRRSYNGSPATSFHGGTDFGGGVGTPIYAAADGQVVMAETLKLRGNAVLIDHGLGLFSGYWHQSQLVVVEGQEVAAGDLLGYMGDTGLVTGPHLHWEMRLQGIAVDPTQWVRQTIP